MDGQPYRDAITVEPFFGPRSDLALLFREADDSLSEINSYKELGEVLVTRHDGQIVGHLQLISRGVEWEIKSLAVLERYRGRRMGTALVRAAIRRAFSAGAAELRVSTATADISNLRFYQRLGFRMDRIERDVFTEDRGYSPAEVDGIPVRDRVWFWLPNDGGGP
jgi:ribosomal protein S18 acetylase RimI-like enzyme